MNVIDHDLRSALRGFRRSPAFTVTAVLILALGIGMAVAMTTVFEAVLVRTLPVVDQERVLVMWTYRDPRVEFSVGTTALPRLRADAKSLHGVAGVAHWGATAAPIVDGDRSLVMNRVLASDNFFTVLGTRPVVGRFFRPEDGLAGAAHVMVLSYASWKQYFGGDSSVVGHVVTEPYGLQRYEIIGVAPAGLDYPSGAGYWIPLWTDGDQLIHIVARLAPGATPASAQGELLTIARSLYPDRHFMGAKASTFTQAVLGDVRPVLVVLTAAVGLLLVIACVNVGNLLLLRTAARAKEIGIRRALGASRADIARQLLVESVLLAGAGGVLGLVAAQSLLRSLIAFAPAKLPRLDTLQLAGTPLAIAVGVTGIAVLLFGVVPALTAARGSASSPLASGVRSGSETRRRRTVRQLLVASQVALALVMLAGAGLLARTLARLGSIDLGYTAEHLVVLAMSFPAVKYDSLYKRVPVADAIMARMRAIPGVVGATPILIPPFLGAGNFISELEVEGQSRAASDPKAFVPLEVGGVDYFRTFGIPIRQGRGFTEADRGDAPQVAVVSEAIARREWPNESPIGKRIKYWNTDTLSWRTVVGVAGDIHFRSLRDATPTIYVPWQQSFWQGMFAVRTSGELASVLPAIRREVRAVDPQLALWSAHSIDELLATPLAEPRLGAFLLSGFGLAALLLAAIGLYGVMASAVREQTREIGVRMALGATPVRLRRDVLGRALIVTSIGTVVGVAGALASSRLVSSLLFEVSPPDPVTLVGVSVLLVAVAMGAAYLPARRATRVDPAIALRTD
jgi:putative ABC transport system permease protein